MTMILKEDIAKNIKVELDRILDTNIFRAGNFHKTNIRIIDLHREDKCFEGYNYSDIHYEVFFKAKYIHVEVHFLSKATGLYESITKKLTSELELGESAKEAEKIIRLSVKGIPYSDKYEDLAVEINRRLKLLKEKIEEVKIGLYR